MVTRVSFLQSPKPRHQFWLYCVFLFEHHFNIGQHCASQTQAPRVHSTVCTVLAQAFRLYCQVTCCHTGFLAGCLAGRLLAATWLPLGFHLDATWLPHGGSHLAATWLSPGCLLSAWLHLGCPLFGCLAAPCSPLGWPPSGRLVGRCLAAS